MRKVKEILFEDRGLPNQRSNQTKSSMSTNLTNKDDTHNSISPIQKKLLNYIAVNGFALTRNRELVNPILQQIQNGLDVIVIPFPFFKYDKQIWVWLISASNKEKEFHIIAALEVLFEVNLSNRRIMVI